MSTLHNQQTMIKTTNQTKNPLISTDIIYKNGQPIQQVTFHNCITALKEYEKKSLEELRWEDYILGRRFGKPPSQPSSQASSRMVTNAINGTYLIKYKQTPGADIKTIDNKSFIYFDTSYASITAMNEYENKSFEELRLEDYSHGHKYPIRVQATHDKLITKTTEPVLFGCNTNNSGNNKEDNVIDSCCPICLETIANLKKSNVKLMVTTCGHIICKQCTNSLVRLIPYKSGLIDCPSCRKKLTQTAIHDLYL